VKRICFASTVPAADRGTLPAGRSSVLIPGALVHHIAYRRAVGAAAIAACVLRVTQCALIVRQAAREAALARPYSRPLAEHAPVMLVLGDSLAVGVGAGRAQDTIAGLLAADFPRISILNQARCGTRTAGVTLQLEGVQRLRRAAAIWVSTGGNDILFNTPLPALQDHLRTTLRAARAASDTVVVTLTANIGLAPLFFWPLSRVLSDRTRRVRDLFRATCRSGGTQFVDFFQEAGADPFSREPRRYFGTDGLHPSADSYRHCYAQILAHSRLHAVLARAQRAW
jgi:lysophospholipase L1-like esterase